MQSSANTGYELNTDPTMEEEKEKNENKGEKGLPNPVEAELFLARVVMVSAPVDARLAHAVCAKLLALERADAEAPVYLFINCPGGEVYSGFSIFDTARFIRPKVVTVVTGLAASMGSIISLCAKPEDRYAFPNSKFLVHQPLMSGGLAGSATDIAIHARDLIDTKNKIIELYARECGRTIEDIKKALDRDTWLNPQQAKEFGLVSKIISNRSELK
jgi:ATP-dependent Clp protease protease subunit